MTVTDKCPREIQFGQFNILKRLINTKVFLLIAAHYFVFSHSLVVKARSSGNNINTIVTNC